MSQGLFVDRFGVDLRRRALALAVLLGAFGCSQAVAQGEESPLPPDEISRWVVPDNGSNGVRGRPLLPEGAFVVGATGRLLPTESGGWVFESTDEEGIVREFQMQPCSRLNEMVRMSQSQVGSLQFKINGQVFLYEGQNYLLPLLFRIAPGSETEAVSTAPMPEQSPPQANDNSAESEAPERDDSVDNLIDALRTSDSTKSRAANRVADAGEGEVQESRPLLREGTFVVGRRGRVHLGPKGEWLFSTENDADTDTETDPPLVILPCLHLEDLARTAHLYRGTITVTISGPVYVFGGQNYVWPRMYALEVDREGNIVSAQ